MTWDYDNTSMPDNRFFVDTSLATGQTVILDGDEAHHLAKVMRVRPGETVELINGRGALALAILRQVDRDHCLLEISEVKLEDPDRFALIIAQAIPRMNRLDTILEKGTELGMSALWLFPGERSERPQISDQQKKRTHTILISASKQCGRLYLPDLQIKPPLAEWSKLDWPAFFGTLKPGVPTFSEAWQRHMPKRGALFFVGPEAGFSSREEANLERLGAIGVSLHPNILRTDTAPLVALTLMHHFEKTTPL